MLGVGANTSVGGCLGVSCEDAHRGLKESETEVILIGNAQVEQTKKNTRLKVVLYLQQAEGVPRSDLHRCSIGQH